MTSRSLVQCKMATSISASDASAQPEKRVWYRGTLFNATVIGAVGFLAPGLWNAMNSLGAGGAQSPFLINAANALVFGLSMCFQCLYMENLGANMCYSGTFVSIRWSYCEPNWLELDSDAGCCWVPCVFVCAPFMSCDCYSNEVLGLLCIQTTDMYAFLRRLLNTGIATNDS